MEIIPYLINKHLSKRRNIKTDENISDKGINYIYNDKENKFSKKLIISTLKVSIFEFLGESLICIYIFFNDKPGVSSYYTLQIYILLNTITQYMVSYIVLNYHFYKHHYLSFGINIGCIIFLIIVDTEQIIEKKIFDYQFYILIVMHIIKLLLFSIEDNYAKYALYTEFLSPFSLLLSLAIYETIFLIIFTILFCF